jgi:hypothetical protein
MCPDPCRSRTFTRHIGLLALVLSPLELRAQVMVPAPMSARPGTVLVYRNARGETVEDSIAAVGSGRVVMVRHTFKDSVVPEPAREIRRTPTGFRQRDEAGEQLLAPIPWPPTNDWESTYRGTRYRYTYLGDTTVSIPLGAYTAAHLQLAIIGRSTTFYDLWVVSDLGIVRRTTRGGGRPTDYQLVAMRMPSDPVVARADQPIPAVYTASGGPSDAPTSAKSATPVEATRLYLGVGGWWYDRDLSRRSRDYDDTSRGLLGWHVEIGIAGPVGLRGRYGQADEQFTTDFRDAGLARAKLRFASAELLFPVLSGNIGRVYVGGGGQWTANRAIKDAPWTGAALGTLGLDTGTRAAFSLYAEIQWTSGGIPKARSENGYNQQGGAMIVAGLRWY